MKQEGTSMLRPEKNSISVSPDAAGEAAEQVESALEAGALGCADIDREFAIGQPMVRGPNKYGRAVVWPYHEYVGDDDGGTWGVTKIRCFMPGTEAVGDSRQYVQSNMIMSASNDRGNPILNNMGGRCQLNRLIDSAANTVETHGYCSYADADNDQIFEKCDFLPGKPNTCELTGGTGKFQGLHASIVITSTPVKSTYDGALQIVGHKNGTYKIVEN
jgi:hypothetical protein